MLKHDISWDRGGVPKGERNISLLLLQTGWSIEERPHRSVFLVLTLYFYCKNLVFAVRRYCMSVCRCRYLGEYEIVNFPHVQQPV